MLGTPPAFILSQDQTLLFNLWFRSTLVNLSRFYCLLGCSLPLSIPGTVPLNYSFRIFRVALLFICQGPFALAFEQSRFFSEALRPSSGHPALSGLRAFLSRNGDYLITRCFLSQALFSTFFEAFCFCKCSLQRLLLITKAYFA